MEDFPDYLRSSCLNEKWVYHNIYVRNYLSAIVDSFQKKIYEKCVMVLLILGMELHHGVSVVMD